MTKKNLDDLRRDRKAAAQAMSDAADALSALEASGNADATAMQAAQTAFEAADSTFKTVAAQVQRAEQVEAAQAAAAGTGDNPAKPGTTAPATVAEKGLALGRMIRLLGAAGGNVYIAQQIAEKNGDSALFANQNMQTGAAGGFLVPEDVAAEVIELLRPASVVMSLQPQILPMPNANLTMNRLASGASAGYIGEQQNVPATNIQHGQLRLTAKKLAALIPVSNDLLRAASTAYDRLVRDDMLTALGMRMDWAFIRGSGTEYIPRGLRFQNVGTAFESTHILTMTASPNLVNVTTDLGRLELALQGQDVPMTRCGWLMAPRSAMYLQNLRDGNGNLAFPEMANGLLRGKPFRLTTQIPVNLGSGSDSEIILADFSQIVVGEHMGIEIAMSTEAAYIDASATMRAAFSRDETIMRAIAQHDIGTRHLPAIAVLTGVTWA
jgi:HK97 family phage major capsid protein